MACRGANNPILLRGRHVTAPMDLAGSILENVENAVTSARRLRGHPVYKDTLAYWADLLREARRARQDLEGLQSRALEAAILNLEGELADRPA